MLKLSAAIMAIAVAAAPALAAEPKPAAIRVSAADLDLSRASDQHILKTRVTKAIAEACNGGGVYHADLTIDKDCAREIAAQADMRILSMSSARSASAADVATPTP